jgi:hypothetical protein
MKHRPRPRHLAAGLILAVVAAASGYQAVFDRQISQTQVHIATSALRGEFHQLYPVDFVYGQTQLWRLTSPAFLGIMELVLVPTGFDDPTLAFRCFVVGFVMLHLAGMYALTYRQTKLWSVSVLAAVLSAAVTNCLGRWFWGVGSLESITPASACLATVPLVVLTFLEHQRDWRLVLVFLFVGLLGNIHLTTSLNLTLVLVLTYLAQRRFAPWAWPMALACVLAAVVAMLPYAAYFLTLQAQLSQSPETTGQAVREALRTAEIAALYPELLDSLLSWLLRASIVLLPALAVLLHLTRYPVRNRSFWTWLMGISLLVALGFQAAGQLLGLWRGSAPLAINFIQASVLVMFAAHVLLASAATHLLRLVRHHKGLVRAGLAVLALAWLVPSDNLRVAKRGMYDLATSFLDEPEKPLHVQELHFRKRRRNERRDLARWTRDNTPLWTVVLTEDIEFRMRCRRSLLACPEDIRYTRYLGADRLTQWWQRLRTQRELLTGAADPVGPGRAGNLARWIQGLASQPPYDKVQTWLLLVEAQDAPDLAENFAPITEAGGGEFHLLLRYQPPQNKDDQTPSSEDSPTP